MNIEQYLDIRGSFLYYFGHKKVNELTEFIRKNSCFSNFNQDVLFFSIAKIALESSGEQKISDFKDNTYIITKKMGILKLLILIKIKNQK